jgi:hypothetical protein
MLTVEIKVNGNIVAFVTAKNVGHTAAEHECAYEYQSIHFYDARRPQAKKSVVTHKQSDGILTLAALLCADAAK